MPLSSETYALDALQRHVSARYEAIEVERLRRQRFAERVEWILRLGHTLIPSEHLEDGEIVVSRRVYEEAKRQLG